MAADCKRVCGIRVLEASVALIRRAAHRRKRTVVALGFVLAIMNVCFYLAIDRLPLATVGTIEYLSACVVS